MIVCAAIACRVQSQRLYGKPLQRIEGKTILEHLIFQLKSCKKIDYIVLAIARGNGNDAFIDVAKNEEIKYVFGDMDNVPERLIIAADDVGGTQIVRITPDNPLIYTDNLEELIETHIKGNYDYSNTRGLPDGTMVEVIKKDALIYSLKKGNEKHRHHAASQYIFENQDKFNIFRAQVPKKLNRPDIRLTIDLPEDLLVFRKMYKEIYHPGKLVKVEEAVDYLDRHPEVKSLNDRLGFYYSRAWD